MTKALNLNAGTFENGFRGGGQPQAICSEQDRMPERSGRTIADIEEDQRHRIEALGTMAASVAHEFSNLMQIVLCSLDLLRKQPLGDRHDELLDGAEWGARQASRLTQEVLSFTRREIQDIQVVDLSDIVAGFTKTIEPCAGESVKVRMELAPQSLPARLDPAQLELALLNLVRNATDAMEGTGRIIIRTGGHEMDGLGEQSTVEVSVTDIGPGMPANVVENATAPFFTTKGPGRGSGLGLWMVQRFAASYRGKVTIETALGQGTTVRLVFPRHERVFSGRLASPSGPRMQQP